MNPELMHVLESLGHSDLLLRHWDKLTEDEE